MPLTNDDFCLGTHSRGVLQPKCPFPQGSVRAWSWWKGQRSPEPESPDPGEALAKLLRDGPQGHNMTELARDMRITEAGFDD